MRHTVTLPITYESLKLAGFVEGDPHHFSGEASSLGLPPGEWPEKLETTVGNLQPLVRVRYNCGEELQYVVYDQALGCISLKIFND